MVQGIYVPMIDGELEVREFAQTSKLQGSVGGWIEAVDVPDPGITIYVNEEGLVRRLPFNSRASFVWWYHVPGATQAMLVGNAVIIGQPDEDGNDTDVPQTVIDLLTYDGEYVVLVKVGGISDPVVSSDSKLGSVLLPLAHGNPSLCMSCTRHDGYISATAWLR